MESTAKYSWEERLWAAGAHLSAPLAIMGPIVPLLVWMSQRERSKYVRFQALQAMGYQALLFWMWRRGGPGRTLVLIIGRPQAVCGREPPGALAEGAMVLVMQLLVWGTIGLFFFSFFAIGVLGALFCLLGWDFRYPILGGWLERNLCAGEDVDEVQEERWLAAVCHACAILLMWGAVVPLVVWVTQKGRSAFLRFQALQALIYQAAMLAAYFIWMFLYALGGFAMMFFIAIAVAGAPAETGPFVVLFAIFIGVFMLAVLAVDVLVPAYYLAAAVGSVRCLRGHMFRYPLLGKWLEGRMEQERI